jgi:glycine betaine catabolism A
MDSTNLPATLPARYYTDPDQFQQEIERWYFGSWICAGRADPIPAAGDYFLRDVSGESVILVRDESNRIRCFYNVCRHRGTRICTAVEGRFNSRIQCPYHAWTYGLNGCLLAAPQMDEAFRAADYPLHEVAADLWDGHIFLNFSKDPGRLADQLGVLPAKFAPWRMQDLRLGRRISYEIRANWKLILLNYNECLHCPLIHPTLNKLTDYLGADNEPPSSTYVGGAMGFRGEAETMSLDGVRRRDYLPGLGEQERRAVHYYTIYPNLLLSLHPDYMMIHTVWPQAIDRTMVICEWYFHPIELAKSEPQIDDAVEFWNRTNREDWEIIELSQAGIRSRAYAPGPYSKRETLLHAIDTALSRPAGK